MAEHPVKRELENMNNVFRSLVSRKSSATKKTSNIALSFSIDNIERAAVPARPR
jgi:hypothetical protein